MACTLAAVSRFATERIGAIRATGDPASIAELAPKPIPAERNAAVVLASLHGPLQQFGALERSFAPTPLGKAIDAGEVLSDKQATFVEKILSSSPEIDSGLAKAAACPDYASQLDYSAPPQLMACTFSASEDIRAAGRFLRLKMRVKESHGRAEEAVASGIVLLKLARHYDREPMTVSFLTACALRHNAVDAIHHALSASKISAVSRENLDRELALHDCTKLLAHALKTERAYAIDAVRQPGTTFASRLARAPFFNYKMGGLLDLHAALLPVVDEPWYVFQRNPEHAKLLVAPTGFGTLADLLVPTLAGTMKGANRTDALVRCLRVFNAAQRYAEEKGREADGIADLGLPAEATIDPFSGEPLKARQTAEGWIIYSVGENGVDDGGDFTDEKDVGIGPPQSSGAKGE